MLTAAKILTCIVIFTTSLNVSYAQKANQQSDVVVVVDGTRYLVHSVKAGETLYSLSRLYKVDQEQIFASNPELRTLGLKAGGSIRIPHAGEEVSRKDRKLFNTHTISKGETLYSISKKHGVSIESILSDNNNLDPSKLSVGQSINIRKSELGKSNSAVIESQMEEYGEALNKVAPEGYKYYIADNGETINIIAKRMGVDKTSVAKENNIDANTSLNKGAIIKINQRDIDVQESVQQPNKESSDSYNEATIDAIADEMSKVSIESMLSPEDIIFSAKGSDEELGISLLLPLTINGRAVRQFAEFYKGFLLGVEDLKEMGYNIKVNLFDTQRSGSRIEYIMTDENFRNSDLIIGPVFEDQLQLVVDYAEVRNIPIVSPLATLNKVNSKVVFQMAPDQSHRDDKIGELLTDESVVTLIYSDSNNAEYEKSIVELLASYDMDYIIHSYRYEHPSAISDRNRKAEELIKEMQKDADAFGIKLDSAQLQRMLPDLSTSDLTPLVANKAKHNLFFIMSDNETDVERILSALSSAYLSQRSKNYGSKTTTQELHLSRRLPSPYNVIANPKWRDYKSIDPSAYFNNRVISTNSYQASRESSEIKRFDSRYAAEFNDFASLYAYRGYDVAMIFGEGGFRDIIFGMDGMDYTPLQNGYYFDQKVENGNRVNINWMRVKYNPDFTTTVE